jgi:hypothetical protein
MPKKIHPNQKLELALEDDDIEQEEDSGSETSTISGDSDDDSVNSDDEYFVRFNSATGYDHVDYVMIGSTCYEFADAQDHDHDHDQDHGHNQEELEDENEDLEDVENTSDYECHCQHDVLIYLINGYIDQRMMDKLEIRDLCRMQDIDISSHDIFQHLLE